MRLIPYTPTIEVSQRYYQVPSFRIVIGVLVQVGLGLIKNCEGSKRVATRKLADETTHNLHGLWKLKGSIMEAHDASVHKASCGKRSALDL